LHLLTLRHFLPHDPASAMSRYTAGMERRHFVSILGLGVLAAPLAAEAQQAGKVWRIGYLGNSPPIPSTSFLMAAFIDGLREYGYVEGTNLAIEFRFAQGHEDKYPQLVRELLQSNVELVVTTQTPAALALKEGAKALPVVMIGTGQPVETGLVQSLARPGGNITGVSNQVGDLDGKLVQLARELVPKLSRVAVLWYPSNQASALSLKNTQELAAKQGISVVPASAQSLNPGEWSRPSRHSPTSGSMSSTSTGHTSPRQPRSASPLYSIASLPSVRSPP